MSEYSDRLDRIRENRDKTYSYNAQKGVTSLPQMHKDLYWLLEIVDAVNKEIEINEEVSRIKMESIYA